ncbi:MAG: CPBP family intramembrane metalloprotease [Clostridiales bacterium]|nr:CPBP family intramembrane metalloprotease [Clostridiales bacterium]
MEKISNQERLKPWMGFVLFAVLMALFLTVCVYMQTNWGMTGLVLTEVLFLLLAIGFCLIRKVKIREMFPIKKFSAREFFGSLLLIISGQNFVVILTMLVGMLFPSWMEETGEMTRFLYSGNPVLAFLIVAVTPAICEEAIHRGAILSCFRSIKKDWLIVLIMGLIFGINHMSPLRFLGTAILGGILSFVVVKRNNIILSMLMHFANNAVSALAGIYTAKMNISVNVSQSLTPQVLGMYLIAGVTAPILFVLGCWMIAPEKHRKIRFLFAGILAGVMFITGSILTASSLAFNKPIVQSQMSYTVTDDDRNCEMDFDVEEERNYSIMVVITGKKEAEYAFVLKDEKGNTLIDSPLKKTLTANTFSDKLELPVGSYHTEIRGSDSAVGDHPQITIVVN